jgi:predicted HTH transcriptional regulator
MITKDKIKRLLRDLEADNVERTISTTDTDKFCKAICAFANDMPGKGEPGCLFIGAEDKTGDIKGIEITDQLLKNLASHRDSGQIIPLPSLTVRKESFPGGDIAVVEVRPSDMPPVRYKGRTWIRVGPRQAIASEQKTPYPNRAIRELLMNAVMHRDYQSNAPIRFYCLSDRIEIQNPGGLYGAAADFPHQNDYRNPKIAEAMKVLGYVNQFGRGIAAVQSALVKNGNPPARFIIDSPNYFLVIVKEASS